MSRSHRERHFITVIPVCDWRNGDAFEYVTWSHFAAEFLEMSNV